MADLSKAQAPRTPPSNPPRPPLLRGRFGIKTGSNPAIDVESMSNRSWIKAKSTPKEGRARRIRGWGPGGLCLLNPSQVQHCEFSVTSLPHNKLGPHGSHVAPLLPEIGRVYGSYHAGGNDRIHDLFGGAWISWICNACSLPKVVWNPQIWEYVRKSSPSWSCPINNRNYPKYSG